jgi:hypothetical protein
MLVIISDLHLTDGTSGTTIHADAFNIFRERLTDLARAASKRTVNGKEIYDSGTWHAVFDRAQYRPKDEEFFGYRVMTYLAFFKGDERKGKAFETWSGSLERGMRGS